MCVRYVFCRGLCLSFVSALIVLSNGCGTTQKYTATEQLVMSDAVDRSVARIDFRPLNGSKVYLDTSYLRHVKGEGFVNAEYVTSSLRQQIVGAGCLIQDAATDAEIVIEARIGTLGQDDHRVTFGVPETNILANAAALIPGAPSIPRTGELAFARRETREAAVKVAAFAYDRETRAPVWQSGVDSSVATATDTWVMGIGPFQTGTAREQTSLAGSGFKFGQKSATGSVSKFFDRPAVDYTAEMRFLEGEPVFEDGGVSPDMIGVSQEEIAEQVKPFDSQDKVADADPETAASADSESATAAADSKAADEEGGEKSEQVADSAKASSEVVATGKNTPSEADSNVKQASDPKVESKVVQAKNETPVVEKAGKTADGDNKKNAK